MSMAVSLEARVPLLDHKIVDFMATVPSKLKIKNHTTKYIMKQAMQDLVPQEIMVRKKHGFTLPTKEWFKNDLHTFAHDMLLENAEMKKYFNPIYMKKILDAHKEGRENYEFQLCSLISFAMWHKLYVEKKL